MFSKIILAVSSIAIIAAPAAAADTPQAPKKSQRAEPKSDSQKYCLTYERGTGSRIETTQCKTRRAWASEGVDVDDPGK